MIPTSHAWAIWDAELEEGELSHKRQIGPCPAKGEEAQPFADRRISRTVC